MARTPARIRTINAALPVGFVRAYRRRATNQHEHGGKTMKAVDSFGGDGGAGGFGIVSGMKRIGSITAVAVAMLAFASAAAAQSMVVRKVYWTQPQVEAAVRHQLRVPYCRIFPDDSGCASVPGMRPRQAQCMGVDELGTSFSYSRFTCRIVVTDYYGKPLASGTVAVYPRSATVFAWRLIG